MSPTRRHGARPPMMRHDLAGMRLGLFRDRRTAVSGAATAALLAALEVADGLASKDPEDDIRDQGTIKLFGTVMAAARAGVPQLVVPHLLDQYYWGQRVLDLGVGPPPIPKLKMNAKRLAPALRRLVDSARMRANARRLAVPLKRRNGAGQAAGWIADGGQI